MKQYKCDICRLAFVSAAAAKRHRHKGKCKPPPLRLMTEREYLRTSLDAMPPAFFGLSHGVALAALATGMPLFRGRKP